MNEYQRCRDNLHRNSQRYSDVVKDKPLSTKDKRRLRAWFEEWHDIIQQTYASEVERRQAEAQRPGSL